MPILSVRLDEGSLRKIRDLAGKEKKDQSAVARELISQGWDYVMLRRFREGKLSLGKLAQELGRSVGETLDLVTDLGVPAPLEFEDYLQGFETLNRIKKPQRRGLRDLRGRKR